MSLTLPVIVCLSFEGRTVSVKNVLLNLFLGALCLESFQATSVAEAEPQTFQHTQMPSLRVHKDSERGQCLQLPHLFSKKSREKIYPVCEWYRVKTSFYISECHHTNATWTTIEERLSLSMKKSRVSGTLWETFLCLSQMYTTWTISPGTFWYRGSFLRSGKELIHPNKE